MNGGATVGKRFQLKSSASRRFWTERRKGAHANHDLPVIAYSWFVNVLSALLLDGRMIHDIVVGSWVVRVEL